MEYLIEKTVVDLEEALKKEPLICRELEVKMAENPMFLLWWWNNPEPSNDVLIQALEKSTVKNDYHEYDNIDIVIKSAWSSKQKGTGKSSVGLSMKLLYDEVISRNGFSLDEVFFVLTDKLRYIEENAGKLNSRMLILDEMLPLIGQSSNADTARMGRLDDTCRIRGINNVYVSPRGEQWFNNDLTLETVWKDPVNNVIVCCLRTSEDDALGWVAFPRPRWEIWEKYQAKKNEFLKKLDTGEIREMRFKGLYEKLVEKFDIENKFEEEKDYFDDLHAWIMEGGKGMKPIKPRVPITPKRLRTWIVTISPEYTGVELDVASESVYAMLEHNVLKKQQTGGENDGLLV